MRIRAMIAEDERLVREELAYLLQLEDDVLLCPSAETGEQLLELQEQYCPDVIFLDIQMPGLSGVEVAKRLRRVESGRMAPLFVFTTAYDDYAVEAFELEAVDYLLKPYDDNRFKIAMERVRKRIATKDESGRQAPPLSHPRPSKVLITDEKSSFVLAPESIIYVAKIENVLEIHTKDQLFQSKMTLRELEEKLRGFPFFRSHRAYLINLDYVQEITPWFNGTYNLTMDGEKESKIPVSRAAGKRLFDIIENA
ncbi:response regulator transcription factor [Salicibibacter cibarius]|uniref:Response regulator transcription factor n=1 Tax=Salicibibacter cibarius TaxID=2743000 RepID=A0A7T6Z4S5_9BACI|nr:LytTR family DNA-binding domain-containing protein [Salicibibacter cibarius]QQK76861.1 response regulator transcription factor [Salicibibacter cibarius]